MKHIEQKDTLSVYFNSACPVCNKGINGQKDKTAICPIIWKDVHKDKMLVNELDKSISTVRKYLHVTDKNNQQHIGIDAFILLWENSPKEQFKATLFKLPLIKQLAKFGYFIFANGLYFWNKTAKRW